MAQRFGWLTPDVPPADTICRVLVLPADFDWLAIVSGAIVELTNPNNFEEFGTSTPEDTATVFTEMFDKFSANEGICRVIGEIISYAGSTSPTGKWLVCDGTSYLRTDYPDLFAVIGTSYGALDGTHFSVPDLRGRVPIGAGAASGLTSYSIGDNGGEEAHTLITSEIPSHSHTDAGHTHVEGNAAPAVGAAITGVPVPSAVPTVGVTGAGSANILSTGGDGAHENRQPYLAITYLIVAQS